MTQNYKNEPFIGQAKAATMAELISNVNITGESLINQSITGNQSLNPHGTSMTTYLIDMNWVYIFLYTFTVASVSYYLGNLLSLNSFTSSSLTLSFSQYNCLRKKYLKVRNQLKFLVISQFIHKRTDLEEFKKILNLKADVPLADEGAISKYEQQKVEFAEAVLNCYVLSWYNNVSDEKSFPIFAKQILYSAFTQLEKKVHQINRTHLAKELILLLHCHWMEYCDMLRKQDSKTDTASIEHFRAIHSYFNKKEEVAKQYEALIAMLLKEIFVNDLQTPLFCQFLSGILVKGFVFYYAEVICDPNWLNATIVSLISATETVNGVGNKIVDSKNDSPANSPTPPSHNETAAEENKENDDLGRDSECKPEQCDEKVKNQLDCGNDDQIKEESENSKGNTDRFPMTLFLKGPRSEFDIQKNTISSVLSGLLSTTAIPLLPEGSKYDLSAMENETCEKQLQIEENIYKPDVDHQSELSKTNAIVITDSDKCKSQPQSRHFSINEPPKQRDNQCLLEKTTQSLDDNRTAHKVVRQEEFDSLFEPSQKKTDKNASPMYEDTEDFASTIAKLRSLLEQKQSNSKLIDPVQPEDEPLPNIGNDVFTANNKEQSVTNSNSEQPTVKVRQNFNSQSSVSSTGTDCSTGSSISQSLEVEKLDPIMDEMEESEVGLRRIFINVAIPKTETCGGDSTAQSILFCIQYEGVYVQEDDYDNSQKLVLRTTTIKRRFKEFLTLQSQLEENQIWKPHLKHIKTPSKWLTLSFPNQNSMNQRKTFLEKYLQQLCYHPILGFSPEVRQFMAYGEDGFQAFEMLTSNSLPFQRLDKIAKTFTGVINSLKDALPSFEGDALSSVPPSPNDVENKGRLSPSDPKAKKMLTSLFNFGEKASAYKAKAQQATTEAENSLKSPNIDLNPNSSLNSGLSTSKENESESPNRTEADLLLDGSFESAYPLASVFTQFLCDVLWMPPQRPHAASIAAFLSISGKSLENYLQDTLKLLLSEDAFTFYLNWLTFSINEWMEVVPTSAETQGVAECTVTDLKQCLRQRIPVWARWMWGRKRIEMTIDRLAGFCQYVELNHDFLLSVVELLFSKLIDNCDEIYNNATAEPET